MVAINVGVEEGYYNPLRAVYLGAESVKALDIPKNKTYNLCVREEDGRVSRVSRGTLAGSSLLTGMASIFKRMGLVPGMQVRLSYDRAQPDDIVFSFPTPDAAAAAHAAAEVAAEHRPEKKTFFERSSARYIHFEAFRPENHTAWKPEVEVDIYLAFGVLMRFLPYSYCCGVSVDGLRDLGVENAFEGRSKPDAILIDDETGEYLMAEFKVRSSQFSVNHHARDVDVLVCWENDGGSGLPERVIALKDFAGMFAADLAKR